LIALNTPSLAIPTQAKTNVIVSSPIDFASSNIFLARVSAAKGVLFFAPLNH
jgi:hypothetical protein